MKKELIITMLVSFLITAVGCNKDEADDFAFVANNEVVIKNKLLSSEFVGNGAQWGGYDMVPDWLGTVTLSETDWNTLYQRIDFMRPPFLRIMTSAGWSYINNGVYDETTKTNSLYKMLDYAQSRNIEVSFGEWGHHYSSSLENIDMEWIANSVKFLNHLVNDKGYSCIQTVNIINEPNGDWSSTKGNYTIWKNVQELYLEEMAGYKLSEVKLMGPDIAIFESAFETNWITRAENDLGDNLGLYDIHVYPKQQLVRKGDYTQMLEAYRKVTPESKKIVLGEIGFKYTEVDAGLKAENQAAIAKDPFAGDDSNMMVYKAFYGIDMADALIQAMRAGFSGALVWSMDDAMYNSPDNGDYQSEKLKRWGFWNILGEEHCGDPSDEEIRPYFYTVSLLCRYFPAGCDIYDVDLPDKKGVRAIVGAKNGKYTIALVNSHLVDYELVLKSDFIANAAFHKYHYQSNSDGSFVGKMDDIGFAIPTGSGVNIDFEKGHEISLKGQSFMLYTNMD